MDDYKISEKNGLYLHIKNNIATIFMKDARIAIFDLPKDYDNFMKI
jgi:hypothetical protein